MSDVADQFLPGISFATVIARRCSNPDHIVWEVTYQDGSPDYFHQGKWPNTLHPQRRQQLRQAADLLRQREQRGRRPGDER